MLLHNYAVNAFSHFVSLLPVSRWRGWRGRRILSGKLVCICTMYIHTHVPQLPRLQMALYCIHVHVQYWSVIRYCITCLHLSPIMNAFSLAMNAFIPSDKRVNKAPINV